MKTCDIQIRDPFVYPDRVENTYYLFGTTDQNCWRGPGQGFNCYKSKNLSEWDGPIPAFRPSGHFWGKENFWAPEVHKLNDQFYMFATFKAEKRYRGTQILVSDKVYGPYILSIAARMFTTHVRAVFTTHVRVMFTTSLESKRHFEVSVVGGFDFS